MLRDIVDTTIGEDAMNGVESVAEHGGESASGLRSDGPSVVEAFTSILGRVNAMYDDIGRSLTGDGSQLRCVHCGQIQALSEADAIQYTKAGWPKCCGYTMRLEAADAEANE